MRSRHEFTPVPHPTRSASGLCVGPDVRQPSAPTVPVAIVVPVAVVLLHGLVADERVDQAVPDDPGYEPRPARRQVSKERQDGVHPAHRERRPQGGDERGR
eukprot:150852-Alexandrium_andersonii.AAC.1